ncbi:hypothetical protein PR048_027389 [Dryococelus australis]|uniref:Uncharacterized protein n=1 Tax=Dryococelus australis TaxID=614101 RepID=A0ABQ9GFB7_9NEOP|nr:hypothetical protein PR048_027389 [Dryococelus australis]
MAPGIVILEVTRVHSGAAQNLMVSRAIQVIEILLVWNSSNFDDGLRCISLRAEEVSLTRPQRTHSPEVRTPCTSRRNSDRPPVRPTKPRCSPLPWPEHGSFILLSARCWLRAVDNPSPQPLLNHISTLRTQQILTVLLQVCCDTAPRIAFPNSAYSRHRMQYPRLCDTRSDLLQILGRCWLSLTSALSCERKRDWGRIGKEPAMALVRDLSQHSPRVVSENHEKQKSGWPYRELNPGPPECESKQQWRHTKTKVPLEGGATVAERLVCSPPSKANRVQSPVGSPNFRNWGSCRTMPLVGGFSRGSPKEGRPSKGGLLAANPGEVLVLRPPSLFRPAEEEFAEDHREINRRHLTKQRADIGQLKAGLELRGKNAVWVCPIADIRIPQQPPGTMIKKRHVRESTTPAVIAALLTVIGPKLICDAGESVVRHEDSLCLPRCLFWYIFKIETAVVRTETNTQIVRDAAAGADSAAPRRNRRPTSPSLLLERCSRGWLPPFWESRECRQRRDLLASQTSSRLLEFPIRLATTQECSGETGWRLSPPRRITLVGEDSRLVDDDWRLRDDGE